MPMTTENSADESMPASPKLERIGWIGWFQLPLTVCGTTLLLKSMLGTLIALALTFCLVVSALAMTSLRMKLDPDFLRRRLAAIVMRIIPVVLLFLLIYIHDLLGTGSWTKSMVIATDLFVFVILLWPVLIYGSLLAWRWSRSEFPANDRLSVTEVASLTCLCTAPLVLAAILFLFAAAQTYVLFDVYGASGLPSDIVVKCVSYIDSRPSWLGYSNFYRLDDSLIVATSALRTVAITTAATFIIGLSTAVFARSSKGKRRSA
jgi:hypothetical protein